MEPILQIENLTHVYSPGTPFERQVLCGVNLDILPGQFVGVIGRTGSGKSTLIQHLNGLLKPTAGRVLAEGRDVCERTKGNDKVCYTVGLVFQYPEYQLFAETVALDIAFGPKNMGLPKSEIDRRVQEAAAFVGLSPEMLEKSPFELSGGEKRRVAIAGVLAMEPKVLVLDEPTAGLDPHGRDVILQLLRTYRAQKGGTVIMVSHAMEEVARLCDRIVVLGSGGTIAMDGTPREIFARAPELRQLGLDVPQATKIAYALRERGLEVDTSVYTVEDLLADLLRRKGGGR